jgi:hypothetical protein
MNNKTIYIAILGLIFFLCPSQAAHLTAYTENSGLWGQVDRYINDSDTEIPSSPIANAGSTSAYAGISGATDYSSAQGTMSGQVTSASYWGDEIGTALLMNSYSACFSSDDTAEVWAYGDVSAVVPMNTCGIFFTLEPDAGETLGTAIRIQLHWYTSVQSMRGNTKFGIGSFGGNTIYVTRNVLPPVNDPPTTGIVWSKEVPELPGPGFMDETGSFVAQIGDTIGIFMGVSTRADLSGVGDSVADVSTGMELLADETMPTLIEYPYAPGLVYDPIQNITFLKDWSAFPDIMSWYDASDEAASFTYTSNSITYSNWRLPITIDEQGGVSGELGYLYTHYGINEMYFGPFVNVSAGDYWTSPLFERGSDIIAYSFTYSTTYGPAQYWGYVSSAMSYLTPVFDGPPLEFWCPADFNNDGIVDLEDFVTFASYWLNERP